MLEVTPQTLKCLQLGSDFSQLLLRLGQLHGFATAGQHALGFFLGLAHGSFIDVVSADGAIHEHHIKARGPVPMDSDALADRLAAEPGLRGFALAPRDE